MATFASPTIDPGRRDSPLRATRPQPARTGLQAAQREILVDMAARLLAGDDPDREVMPALFVALAGQSIVDATLGFVVCDMEEVLKLGFMHGFDRETMQRCLTLDFGQAVCGTVAATRQPMHVTDVQRSLDPLADLVRSAGINAYACEPLIAEGRLLGTISFASRTRRRFEADEILFFPHIARLLAVARARARSPLRQAVPA